jgi:hypothetical protein
VKTRLLKYGQELLKRTGLKKRLNGRICSQISIHEDVSLPAQAERNIEYRSIHSLLWEVLEDPGLWHTTRHPRPVQIARVVTHYNARTASQDPMLHSVIQNSCRILLVIARSFQYKVTGSGMTAADYSPELIQGMLLDIATYLEHNGIYSYLSLDIVRPGTFDSLEKFMEWRYKAGVTYDLVHFDLHGVVDRFVISLSFLS